MTDKKKKDKKKSKRKEESLTQEYKDIQKALRRLRNLI